MRILRQSLSMLALLSILTGVLYPLAVTGVAQLLLPHPANGSLIVREDRALGSALIGQPFSAPQYFWPRPSATTPFANNSSSSSGSNLGPTNTALSDAVKQRIDALRAVDPGNTAAVPVDLVTASASGLDPHITPAAAQYQLSRVARARGKPEAAITALVAAATEGRQFGVLGEPRVNVLVLNLALDRL